ncbi:MAG: DNA polymerase IV [Ethanoligenens sp.]
MKETRKVIFLVDINAFFIGCEAVEDPSLRTKPAAVAGDPQRRSGIILTANYPARKYGVRTTMTIYQAQKLCPQITLIPPHRALYEKTSRMVMDLLGQYTPVMEQSSIDEAYLDLTGCERLWGEPLQAAQTIMERIGTELGLQCSIGISENKFLAKMAADFKKPQGITELWLRDVPRKLWQLPVGELYGIGKQTAAKLRSMGFRTVGDLAALDSAALRVRFGRYGEEMHRLANGLDDTPVTPHDEAQRKSIGRSTTLPQDITSLAAAKAILSELAEEVGAELRAHNRKSTTVQITIKYADFQTITRQCKIPPTDLTRKITDAARELLEKSWSLRAVRLLGISVSGFDNAVEDGQLSLFTSAAREEAERKEEQLERAVDGIRDRFGNNSVKRAAFLSRGKTAPPDTDGG